MQLDTSQFPYNETDVIARWGPEILAIEDLAELAPRVEEFIDTVFTRINPDQRLALMTAYTAHRVHQFSSDSRTEIVLLLSLYHYLRHLAFREPLLVYDDLYVRFLQTFPTRSMDAAIDQLAVAFVRHSMVAA